MARLIPSLALKVKGSKSLPFLYIQATTAFVVQTVRAARTSLILACICTRAFAFATLNAFQNCLYNLFVRIKLPTFFDVKLHILKIMLVVIVLVVLAPLLS